MPHNSCIIILNGHGSFDSLKIVDMTSCPHGYSIVFPCKYKESITAAHHNLIVATLTSCPATALTRSLEIIEASMTTSRVNNKATGDFLIDMMDEQHLHLFYEHTLSNAQDVLGAHALEHTNGCFGNPDGRFKAVELQTIEDQTNPRNWGSCNLHIEFDIIEAEASVKANISQDSSPLSETNILCFRPVAPQGSHASFLLSDLISSIIPRIKIFASKHADNSVQVLPYVFLDDRNDPAQNLADCIESFPDFFTNPDDKLHELFIAGDANVIWDACRESA